MKIEQLHPTHPHSSPADSKTALVGRSRYVRRLMRTGIVGFFMAGVVLSSAPAAAQYANKSLGLGVGYSRFNADTAEWAVPIALSGTLYIDNGFEAYAYAPLMIIYDRAINKAIVAGGLDLGARYLFMEESFRPYVGVQAGFLYINREIGPKVFFGPGASLGFEYFVTDSISIGPRGFFDLYIAINEALRWSYGASFGASAYF